MPEFMREAFEFTVLALLIIIGGITLFILIMNVGFAKYLTKRKYRISTHFEFEPLSKEETFSIHIYNNNLTDARLAGLGYIYKHQTIDYYKTYLKQIDYSLEGKIVIPSRDSIKIKIDIDSLLAVINDYNQGKHKVKPLNCFVTDSLGMTTTVKAKTIKKVIKKRLKSIRETEKINRQTQLKIQKTEMRESKRKASEVRKQKRKIRREKIRLWFKERANKIRKNRSR